MMRRLTVANPARAAGWAVLVAIVVATLSPIEYRPKTGHVVPERAIAYALLGLLWGVGYRRQRVAIAAAIVALAVLLELGQGFVPGRHGHVVDSLEKLVGGLAGLALAAAGEWGLQRRSKPGA